MDERKEAIEYLEDQIPNKIINRLTKSENYIHGHLELDVDEGYQHFEDFVGTITTEVLTEDDDEIGEIEFYIEQKPINLKGREEYNFNSFKDYVKNVKIVNYEIY